MKSTTLYLIRHGETEWNRSKRLQGHQDIPLNDAGEKQALFLAEELQEVAFDAVYASPLMRALHTAKPLSYPVKVDHRLKEMSYGIYDGMTRDDFYSKLQHNESLNKEEKWHHKIHETAETLFEVYSRAKECLDDLIGQHQGEKIAIVSHGGLIKTIISKMENIETDHIEVGNVGYVVLHVAKAQYTPIHYCRIKLGRSV